MEKSGGRHQVVLVTAGSDDEARTLAGAIVERGLAACVNVLPPIRSVYRWKGRVQEDEERLLVIKSSRKLLPVLRETILELHSYEVPEILALPVEAGDPAYLRWMEECLGGDTG
jgi:periplasmic divalent cation tolerance protein